MKNLLIAIGLAASFTQPSHAITLTFEDVPNGSVIGGFGDMPLIGNADAYQDFQFSSTLDWIDVGDYWNYGAKSGRFALLNNYGGVGIVSKQGGGEFTFDGLWAKSWGSPPESGANGVVLTGGVIQGFKAGQLIWSVDATLDGSYQYFAAQAGAIDELHIGFGNNFLVDNLSLNGVSAVPEASTLSLALSGLGCAVLMRRRPAARRS